VGSSRAIGREEVLRNSGVSRDDRGIKISGKEDSEDRIG